MPRTYSLSFEADEDLKSIFDYVAASSGLDRAEDVLTKIESVFQMLADSPSLGRRRFEFQQGPRSWVVLRWVIFYEPVDANKILVLRVLDGSRDLSRILRNLD